MCVSSTDGPVSSVGVLHPYLYDPCRPLGPSGFGRFHTQDLTPCPLNSAVNFQIGNDNFNEVLAKVSFARSQCAHLFNCPDLHAVPARTRPYPHS